MIATCKKIGRQSQTHECNCRIFYSLLRLPFLENKTLYERTKLNFNEFDNLWKWNLQINLCEEVIRILGFTVELRAKGFYIWQLCNWIICAQSSSQHWSRFVALRNFLGLLYFNVFIGNIRVMLFTHRAKMLMLMKGNR